MRPERRVLLAIDTASDQAGVALVEDDALLGEVTWLARQSHSVQLLPAIDWLLGHTGRRKEDLTAIAVCLGPGSYAGLRVGLSTAKALAFALGAPLAGVGRLAAEALPVAQATKARVIPVQAAGRAELAWAAYSFGETGLEELTPPRLSGAPAILDAVRQGDVLTGDVDRLEQGLAAEMEAKGCRLAPPAASRVLAIASLGYRRIERGDVDNPDTLVPLYLRAPAIGPQGQGGR